MSPVFVNFSDQIINHYIVLEEYCKSGVVLSNICKDSNIWISISCMILDAATAILCHCVLVRSSCYIISIPEMLLILLGWVVYF